MNQTQSIIVYRNPMEQQFWESGVIIPLGGALIVGTLVFIALMKLADRFVQRSEKVADLVCTGAAMVAISAGWLVFNKMMF